MVAFVGYFSELCGCRHIKSSMATRDLQQGQLTSDGIEAISPSKLLREFCYAFPRANWKDIQT